MHTFRPRLEALEDRTLPSNIVWNNRLTPSDKFTPRERAVVDQAIVIWESLIEDFNSQVNELHLVITGGNKSGVRLPGRTAGIASLNFPPLANADRVPFGTVRIDNDGGGGGWYIDPNPRTHSEFTKKITPAHRGNGPRGNDMLSVLLHEIGHVLGLPHFKDANDLMNPVGTSGHRYLPSARDIRWLAHNAGITMKPNATIVPKVSFVARPQAWGEESVTNPAVNVFLSAVPLTTVTVNYSVTGGSATAGGDFTLAGGTLTFSPGEYKKSIPLTIIDDAVLDAAFAESIQISLSSPAGAVLWPAFSVHVYDIFDNDF